MFQRFYQLVGGFNPSENISQIGNLPQIGVNIKNIWNHLDLWFFHPSFSNLPKALVSWAGWFAPEIECRHSPIGWESTFTLGGSATQPLADWYGFPDFCAAQSSEFPLLHQTCTCFYSRGSPSKETCWEEISQKKSEIRILQIYLWWVISEELDNNIKNWYIYK